MYSKAVIYEKPEALEAFIKVITNGETPYSGVVNKNKTMIKLTCRFTGEILTYHLIPKHSIIENLRGIIIQNFTCIGVDSLTSGESIL